MDLQSKITCIIAAMIMIFLGIMGQKIKLFKDDFAINVLSQLSLILGLAGLISIIILPYLPIWE